MVCVYCSSETQVINSRLQKRRNQVWRRRRCVRCNAVFSTTEQAEYAAVWQVTAQNGTNTPFRRDKLFLSLYSSLQHRTAALSEAGDLADTVIGKLNKLQHSGVMTAAQITSNTEVVLNRFDTAASVHYRAMHPNR